MRYIIIDEDASSEWMTVGSGLTLKEGPRGVGLTVQVYQALVAICTNYDAFYPICSPTRGRRDHKQAVPYKSAPGPAQYYALDGSATVGFFPMLGTSYWTISTPSGEAIGRMTTSGSASYYIKDHLGSVRAVVNSSGSVLETRDYYPFGLEMPGRSYLSGTKAKENFTGHERDAETGMLYAGARYYMPNIGRWTSVDPLAASYPAWSPYNYVLNNPLGFVDPDGRSPAIPWVIRGAWSAYRAYRAGQAAAATVTTVAAAQMTAGALQEGMSQVDVGTGAPPISVVDIGIPNVIAPDATGVPLFTPLLTNEEEIKQAEKGISSLERQITEHKQKLEDYLSNPESGDHQGRLRKAPTNEIREQIIHGRARKLEREVRKFESEVHKLHERIRNLREGTQ